MAEQGLDATGKAPFTTMLGLRTQPDALGMSARLFLRGNGV